jgi:hypothetical protein
MNMKRKKFILSALLLYPINLIAKVNYNFTEFLEKEYLCGQKKDSK